MESQLAALTNKVVRSYFGKEFIIQRCISGILTVHYSSRANGGLQNPLCTFSSSRTFFQFFYRCPPVFYPELLRTDHCILCQTFKLILRNTCSIWKIFSVLVQPFGMSSMHSVDSFFFINSESAGSSVDSLVTQTGQVQDHNKQQTNICQNLRRTLHKLLIDDGALPGHDCSQGQHCLEDSACNGTACVCSSGYVLWYDHCFPGKNLLCIF
ncbi:unnamed protein product [Soboliphyme baturini]|uniref:EB domain-containing protein n=1 Tax=Soboliphyme baturini TaxID=241478 RepID=A0A183IIA5_9BILA|nr:unnamed protein product [Soboliphyme baturini]